MADKGRLWSAEYIMVLFSMLCNGMAGMMTVPLVAKYAIQTGADLTVASAVAGLMSLVALIICPFAGALCDRCSRKRILIFANFGYGCSLALHSVCTVLPALVLIRLITGVFFSVCTVANVAYSSSYIPNQRMGEGLGYVGLTTIVAQALGPSLGLELQEKGGFGLTFAVAGCFAAVCMISVILMPYQSSTVSEVKRKKTCLKDLYAVQFTVFMLMAVLLSSAGGLISTYLAIIADIRKIAGITVFFTLYSVFAVAFRPFTGRILDNRGIFHILIPAFLCTGMCMFFIGISETLLFITIASFFGALGQGSGLPSIQAHCVKSVSKEMAGVATSTVMIGQNVGNAIAPVIGSFFIKPFGYGAAFCGFGLAAAAAGICLVLIQMNWNRKNGKSVSE